MVATYPPNELLELFQVSRQVTFRYQLDKLEIAALQRSMRSTEKAVQQILSKPSDKLKHWERLRRQDLMRELDALTLGIREQVSGEISSLATQAGAESARFHSDTLSLGGRVKDFNNVALSPEQFKSFFQTTPLGGHTLNQWVNRAFSATVQKGLLDDLNAGVLQGKGYRGLVNNIMGHMDGFTRREAVTLARSFVQTANCEAMKATMQANADIIRGWKWSSVMEGGNIETGLGTCLICASYDANDEIYPIGGGPLLPAHPNCLTAETPVFVPDKVAAFVAAYEGIVFEIVLASGARFTVTPKHMFLTGQGFAAADTISKGDKIFYNPVADRVIFGNPDNNRDNSRIANIIESFSKNPGMVTVSVPAAAEHLHGDGQFIKGDVEVVTFKSLLMGDLETFSSEFMEQFKFSLANVNGVNFKRLGRFLSPLFWLRLASDSLVSGLSVSDVFSRTSLRHHKPVCSGGVSSFDSVFKQYFCDNIPGNAESSSNSIFRNPGNVKVNDLLLREIVTDNGWSQRFGVQGFYPCNLNNMQNGGLANTELFSKFASIYSGDILLTDVVSIKSRKFTGHVYDLQSLTGMYHLDGALSSNCRCFAIPSMVDYKELGLDIEELEDVARPWTIREDVPINEGGRAILEHGKHRGNYETWMQTRGAKFQKNVLGPKRYELWKDGKVKMKDLVDAEKGSLVPWKKLKGASEIKGYGQG